MIRESKVERDWCRRAAKLGFWSIKFKDPERRGAPDRLILGQKGDVFFIEFKRDEAENLEFHQQQYQHDLIARGFCVYVCKSLHDNNVLLKKLEKEIDAIRS